MTTTQDQQERITREVLLHFLEHGGQQIWSEASQWTTEFGILKRFSNENPSLVKEALRTLELGQLVYQRNQYVAGCSEAKHVFSLTPTGHRAALGCQKGEPLKLGRVEKHPRPSTGHDDYPDDDDDVSYSNDSADDNPAEDFQSDSND